MCDDIEDMVDRTTKWSNSPPAWATKDMAALYHHHRKVFTEMERIVKAALEDGPQAINEVSQRHHNIGEMHQKFRLKIGSQEETKFNQPSNPKRKMALNKQISGIPSPASQIRQEGVRSRATWQKLDKEVFPVGKEVSDLIDQAIQMTVPQHGMRDCS